MKLKSDQLLGIGIMIVFGGIMFVMYLGSIFGTDLPGFTVLIPIFIGGGCIIYSLKLPNEIQKVGECRIMKRITLCIYYGISVFIISFGLLCGTNYESVNTLWDNNMCIDSIDAHKAMGQNLSLTDCYNAQHAVQNATLGLVGGLNALATTLFIIGLDMNKREIQNLRGDKQ